MKWLTGIFIMLGLIISNNASADEYDNNGWKIYNVSEQIISTAHQRASYYQYTERRTGYAIPVEPEEFLASADKTRAVVLHAHGCAGIGLAELALQEFYESLGYHFVMQNFLSRGDASSSCPTNQPNRAGWKETVNPNRHRARQLELDHTIGVLQRAGFEQIIVTGHSEGGKTIQGIKSKVKAIIVHAMDAKSTNLWNPNPENLYLFLYSYNDPWITGRGSYPVRSPVTFSNRNKVFEHVSNVRYHGPLEDPAWPAVIKEFLQNGKL